MSGVTSGLDRQAGAAGTAASLRTSLIKITSSPQDVIGAFAFLYDSEKLFSSSHLPKSRYWNESVAFFLALDARSG